MIHFPTTLHNALIRLQRVQPSDFEALYAVASDPEIWELHPEPTRYQREVFDRYFASALASGSAYLVFDAETGALIGCSRYYDYQAADNSIAIGYTFLARSHWGGRYNSALKSLMLDYAFSNDIARAIFHVGTTNFRSQRALRKIGAQYLGIFTVNVGGKLSEECIFEIVAPNAAS